MSDVNAMVERCAKAMYDAFGEGRTVSYRTMAVRGLLAALDPEDDVTLTFAAANIVDIWMGGDKSWRKRLHDSTFLESGDWMRAREEAAAVLASLRALVQGVRTP